MARHPVHQAEPPAPPRFALTPRIFLLLLALFAVLVYRETLLPGHVLFTTDDNIGHMAQRKAVLPHAFLGAWDDSLLAGQPWVLNLNWTNLLLCLLPVALFQDWIHALDLVPASFFFALYLRRRGVGWAGCALGALAGFWLGSNFFLTYAGHIGKFATLFFASLCLWLTERAVQRRSWADAILAGGAMGGMFLEQADVALFFAMALGPYAVFACWRAYGLNVRAAAAILAPMVLLAGFIAYRPVAEAYSAFAHDARTTDGEPEQSRQELWEYCTQWSWPPEETIEWLAPGYMGWRSGEAAGPYWGRMGRSAGWETTRQGFANFKLETFYLGAIPLALLALQVYLLVTRRLEDRGRRLDAVFWLAVAVVTFLLGLGKFFPLYRLFFELPGMSSFRNPVKFIQVTQFALAIPMAVALDEVLRRGTGNGFARALSPFLRGLAACGGILFLWAVAMSFAGPAAQQELANQGWGAAAGVIMGNKMRALGHAAVLALVAAGLLWRIARGAGPGAWGGQRLAWILLGLVALDQLVVSRHYVKTAEAAGLIDRNPVVTYLQERLGQQRAYLLAQDSFYNQWLTVLFPYHQVPTFNVTQTRFTEDYKAFLAAAGPNPAFLWQSFAVGQLMGHAGFWQQLQADPGFRDRVELSFAYNVAPRGAGVEVIPATQARPGQHVIMRHKAEAPRYCLVAGWEGLTDDAILERVRNRTAQPFQKASVAPEIAARYPPPDAAGVIGEVNVREYRAGRVRLQTAAAQPTILRVSDKFAPAWRARVDGQPTEVFRCDYLFQGVYLDPGVNDVILEYAPPLGSLWVQLAGLAICVLAVLQLAVRERRTAAG